MNRKYWETIAPDYDEEIFDVLHNDKKGLIRAAITKLASPAGTAIDIGCAVGKWLPVLSPLFKKVTAIDISYQHLVIAQRTYPELINIDYLRADMSSQATRLPKSDVAVCINAILTDSAKKRAVFFNHLSRCLRKNGRLVLVAPSLESWMMTRMIQRQWKIDAALFREKISGKQALKKYNNLQEGNAEIDHVPTKHYLREELGLLLQLQGLAPESFQKIEYSWKTEFIKPPKWLKEPKPWDWMVVARKLK